MEMVFRALADRSRRQLLDRLFANDGLTLGQLCDGVSMSRQAVSKHLRILEEAGLVVVDWQGREKRHYLNPVPISEIGDRWVEKFARKRAAAVVALKNALEESSNEGS
jgi:DNA-binding transcriptional ArsR family regulator